MNTLEFMIRSLRKLNRTVNRNSEKWIDLSRVDYVGQAANDLVRNSIEKNDKGLLVSKFGTIELNAICCCKRVNEGLKLSDYIDYINGKGCIYKHESIKALSINAGFFPISLELQDRFTDLVLRDIKDIDILGSYVNQESYLEDELRHCKKIDIYGYCAPFAWNNPWTYELRGKKVLVVHPFADSIKKQYENREHIFKDKHVLPEFEKLIVIKAVQSIAGNGSKTGFADWFEALDYMKSEIDKCDYDIALIGCGAYGMSLAAHCKRQGKIAIHMASWVQMLFGIYGQRWAVDQPEYSSFINKYWVRPSESERPKNLELVEKGAYW